MHTQNLRVFIIISFFLHTLGLCITFFLPSAPTLNEPIQTKIRLLSLPAPLKQEWTTLDFTRKKTLEEIPGKEAALSWKNSKAHAKNRGARSDTYKDIKDTPSYGKAKGDQLNILEYDSSAAIGNSEEFQHTKRVMSQSGIKKKRRGQTKKRVTESPEKDLLDRKNNTLRQASKEKKMTYNDGPISLDTREFNFMPYFSNIFKKINNIYVYPTEALMTGDTGNVYVQFFVDKAGMVDTVSIYKSSGFKSLDDESLRAVRASSPLPPIPEAIGRDRLNIVATFRYRMNFGTQ